jgi:hypothetical protein
LSAFDLKTGNARWRLPTVGIAALYFDEAGNIYVNTTGASHESIKFSRQIDVTEAPGSVVLKVNPADGKVLWRSDSVGWISHVRGKYLFSVSSYRVSEREEALEGTSFQTGFEKQPYVRIRRINPRNGREIWQHFEQRAPLDIEFEANYIRLVFRKEVEILRFVAM